MRAGFRSLWLLCLIDNREFGFATPFFEFCLPVEVSIDVVVSFSSSSLFTEPYDDSGILSVIPIALFISDVVRATCSLLWSFAGGDTACLLETTHSDAAWSAVQHGISADCRQQLKARIVPLHSVVLVLVWYWPKVDFSAPCRRAQ